MAPTNLASSICVLCLLAARSLAAQPSLGERTLAWSADVLSSDFRSDTLELSGNVRVSEGEMSIEAQTATATDLKSNNSRWTFKDGVRIRTTQADLQSDIANASFVNGAIAGARVEGSPAVFEQRGADAAGRQVRGRAGLIDYNFASGIVRLQDEVWFSNGKDEFRGDVVIYHVREERIEINPGGQGGPVRGIIRPGAVKPGNAPSSAPEQKIEPPPESGA